jgi:hypothetical protein
MLLLSLAPMQGAMAETRALIMTIGDYRGGPTPLTGVKNDVKSARSIAMRMGVPEANISMARDQQLTLDGMRKVLDNFDATIYPNDQVFIYFSGHGGRALIRDPEERCAEALVTAEGNALFDNELEARLKKISQKASRVIFFLDACHAGGVTTRSLGKSDLTAKYYAKGGADACEKPVNVLTRGITLAAKTPGSGAMNYAYIAAARDNEVAFDNPERGGVATQNWVECMNGAARDLDGSGGITAEEIRTCAQEKINAHFKGRTDALASNIAITGNRQMVLTFPTKDAAPPPVAPPVQVSPVPAPAAQAAPTPPSAQTVTAPRPPVAESRPTPSPQATPARPPVVQVAPMPPPAAVPPPIAQLTPARPTPPTTAPAAPARPPVAQPAPTTAPHATPVPLASTPLVAASVNATATLRDIYSGRDDRRVVTLAPAKSVLRIGRDAFDFNLTSSHDGNVYLLQIGSDGSTFNILFPNSEDRNNTIRAGETLRLPRDGWRLVSQGPPGKNQLLVIVADSLRDFTRAGFKSAGIFSEVSATSVSTKDIQLVSTTAPGANTLECAGTRTLALQRVCSSAYGAAMVTVEEAN